MTRPPQRQPATRTSQVTTHRARRTSPALPLALGALLLGGGYVGATALFSSRAADTADKAAAQLTAALTASGKVKVESSKYKKGLTQSTQTMTLALVDPSVEKPVRLLVTNHIQHGPVLGAAGMGQALIDTDIRLADPQAQAQLDKAFGGQKPVIRTLVGMTGGSTTDITVPKGQFKDETSPDTVSWQPLTGQVKVNGLKTDSLFNWAGMTVNSTDGVMTFGPMRYDGHLQRENAKDPLGAGTNVITLERLQLTGDQPMALSGLKVSTLSERASNFQNIGTRYEIAQLQVGEQKLQNLKLSLRLDHLARDPLLRLSEVVQKMQSEGAQAAGLSAAQQKQVENDLLALIKASPVLKLEDLSVGQPGRGLQMTGQVALPGAAQLTADNWQSLAGPQALALLAADFKLVTSQQGLQELATALGEQAPDPQMLLESGTLKPEGNNLVTTFALKDGGFWVNGEQVQ